MVQQLSDDDSNTTWGRSDHKDHKSINLLEDDSDNEKDNNDDREDDSIILLSRSDHDDVDEDDENTNYTDEISTQDILDLANSTMVLPLSITTADENTNHTNEIC